jgi:hypothetical protein
MYQTKLLLQPDNKTNQSRIGLYIEIRFSFELNQ